MLYLVCVGVIMLLQLADYNLTMHVLSLPGGYEGNPLVSAIGVAESKVLASIVFALIALLNWSRERPDWMIRVTLFIGGIYMIVVLYSLVLITLVHSNYKIAGI